jgi:hypothetical protein
MHPFLLDLGSEDLSPLVTRIGLFVIYTWSTDRRADDVFVATCLFTSFAQSTLPRAYIRDLVTDSFARSHKKKREMSGRPRVYIFLGQNDKLATTVTTTT